MVLESIIGEKNIKKHPVFIFFITLLICAGSIFFADMMFPTHSSILSVAFITIGLVPLIFNILSDEEADEEVHHKHFSTFFARHFNIIMLYVWVFVGIIVAFSIYYAVAPPTDRPVLFAEQIKSFCAISGFGSCTGGVPLSVSGMAASFGFDACLSKSSAISSCTWFIFSNNFEVLILTVILSLLYGVGAIFMIAWNASILGVFFGEMLAIGNLSKGLGLFQGLLLGHGPPELFGYVFGALAGAILSAMVARGDYSSHHSEIIIKDVLFLSGLAIFSVAYGAATEALGILGMTELYFLMGFLYLVLIILAVFFYGQKRQITLGL